jgi:hypothetical protein
LPVRRNGSSMRDGGVTMAATEEGLAHVDAARGADRLLVLPDPGIGGGPAAVAQEFEKGHLGVELARSIEVVFERRCRDHMHVDPLVFLLVESVLVDEPPHEFDGPHLGDEAGIEADLVQPVDDFIGLHGNFITGQRIDLHQQDVLELGVVDSSSKRSSTPQP